MGHFTLVPREVMADVVWRLRIAWFCSQVAQAAATMLLEESADAFWRFAGDPATVLYPRRSIENESYELSRRIHFALDRAREGT